MTQAEYLTEIIKLLNQCNDIGLLDIILNILEKSAAAASTAKNN